MAFFYDVKTHTDGYGNSDAVKTPRVGRIIGAAILLVVIIVALLNSFQIIPSGYTGVRTTFGQIDSTVVSNGITFKIPFVQKISKVNNKQQEVTFAEQVWGESSERTVVYMAGVTITYKINPEYSAWLYANVTDYVQNALPQTLVASALKAAMVSLPSNEVTNRAKIEPLALQKVQEAINNKYNGEPIIDIVSINVNDMDFEASYNQAIANKQIAQMAFEQAKIENDTAIAKANAEAQQKEIAATAEATKVVIAARAEADSIEAIADAQAEANRKLAESVTEELVEYQKIAKWDGQLPQVTGSTAIIDIPAGN